MPELGTSGSVGPRAGNCPRLSNTIIVRVTISLYLASNETYNPLITSSRRCAYFYGLGAHTGLYHRDSGPGIPSTSIRDGGSARIIECASESLARLVAESGETGEYCFYAGDNRVVAAEKSLRNFLNGLRKLGYVLSADSRVV